MKKNRIQADNVEQLMEIVRSLQRGEEPTQESIRKSTERVPEADAPMSNIKKTTVIPMPETASETEPEAQEAVDLFQEEDEFERLLDEDEDRILGTRRQIERLSGVIDDTAGFFDTVKEKLAARKAASQEKKEAKRAQKETETETAEQTLQVEEDLKEPQEQQLLLEETAEEPQEQQLLLEETAEEPQEQPVLLEETSEEPQEQSVPVEEISEEPQEQPDGRNVFERIAGTRESLPQKSSAPRPRLFRKRKTSAEKAEELKKGFALEKRSFSDCIRDFVEELRERGISRREFMMIGAVAVFMVLMVLMVKNMISVSMDEKRKSEYVTAEEGLKVTVEHEPEAWSNAYPVQLRFRVSGAEMKTIRINEEVYEPDAQGIVTVDTRDWLLEAAVETDQGVRTARIEIPKLDGDAPIVYAERREKMIELTAVDARSSVAQIYYAKRRETDLPAIPLYQKYKEPFTYTEGELYYFYAVDAAGNQSVPVVTNMEVASAIRLKQDTLTLYPGETGDLSVEAEPYGALLNGLSYESLNPELLSVDGSGRVTALAEGTGTVKVSAAGVVDAICKVEVSNERRVTISAIGDCTLGSDISFNTMTSFDAFDTVNGHSYFFKNVRDILAEDDVTFANMEGTLTTVSTREMKEYAFRGDPSYTEVLQNGSVEVVTLANNHSRDYGEQSLEDTKAALKTAGIDYCIGDTIVMKEVHGIRVALIGIYVLNDGMARETQVRETIAQAQSQGAQLIVTAFHWGSEKAAEPDATQESLAHIAIDCGADLVVGHHPHVLQRIEKYNGKYIAYSLGNFCFGGNSTPSDMDTMIFRQTFTVTKDSVAQDDAVTVIPCSISSTPGYNNYQPTPAQGTEAAAIIDRLNDMGSSYGVTLAADGSIAGTM